MTSLMTSLMALLMALLMVSLRQAGAGRAPAASPVVG